MKERNVQRLATLAFALLVIALAIRHALWRDEVRAFSVATKNPSWGVLLSELHHEGHPILWYAILRAGYALTHSSLVLPVAAIVIGIATAWLILAYAPYPIWLRVMAVFGVFLVDELTVVARNYGIGVMLAMVACIAFTRRRTSPILPGLALALLANTSVHAAVAAVILLGAWSFDLLDSEDRRAFLSPQGLGAIALVFAAVAFALWSAHPTPDMAWAGIASRLTLSKIVGTVFTDPGLALRGVHGADIGTVSDLPWHVIGLSGEIARYIIDAAFVWMIWHLRKDWRTLAVIIVAILSFEILFRAVYSGALRHEALLLYLLFAIGWFAIVRSRESGIGNPRAVTLALAPLFAFQTLGLPVAVVRDFRFRESNSKAYASFIRANPKYSNAILMSEPDYMMEPMPYYLQNRVYMPRQREFNFRVYFDRGARRQRVMSLTQLSAIADSVSCSQKQTVLLAIGSPKFAATKAGVATPEYKGTFFTWTEPEWTAFTTRFPLVKQFPDALREETYAVYEVSC
jgi:hypothetical protein